MVAAMIPLLAAVVPALHFCFVASDLSRGLCARYTPFPKLRKINMSEAIRASLLLVVDPKSQGAAVPNIYDFWYTVTIFIKKKR